MEFTDVEAKDFIDLSAIPEHLQGSAIAEQRVKWRLREALQAVGIDEPIERLHYTTWDADSGEVNYSQPLIELLVDAVLNSEAPGIGPMGGIFGARGVNSEQYHLQIDLAAVNEACAQVYRHIKQTEQAG
ncbi:MULTISPECIES: hypothetical protein [unclassified Pseudomonas]|uniref:hypothetical protein n=1 Tax=unclassified Pseudomonas TaxID=196821 RepID=UPI0011A85A56|nr:MULTISPECIES: hypothetical protein [unclassified Pseudomonas]